MKKIIFALGLIIGVSTSVISQNIYLKKTDLDKELCKKWDIDHAKMSGLVIKKLSKNSDFDIEFNVNGTFTMLKEVGDVEEGMWVFNTKKHYVVLLMDEEPIGLLNLAEKESLIFNFLAKTKILC